MHVRYIVELTEAERESLQTFVNSGSMLARKVKRAQILLAADQGHQTKEIAELVGVGTSTVYRAKKRFVERPFEVVLDDESRPGGSRKLTGREEALLVATACSKPPEGRARWTMELLADAFVSLTNHTSLSRETVHPEEQVRPSRGHTSHESFFREMHAELGTPEGRARRRARIPIEHALARVGQIQKRYAKFRGLAKNPFDLTRTAVVANLYVLGRGLSAAA